MLVAVGTEEVLLFVYCCSFIVYIIRPIACCNSIKFKFTIFMYHCNIVSLGISVLFNYKSCLFKFLSICLRNLI